MERVTPVLKCCISFLKPEKHANIKSLALLLNPTIVNKMGHKTLLELLKSFKPSISISIKSIFEFLNIKILHLECW